MIYTSNYIMSLCRGTGIARLANTLHVCLLFDCHHDSSDQNSKSIHRSLDNFGDITLEYTIIYMGKYVPTI